MRRFSGFRLRARRSCDRGGPHQGITALSGASDSQLIGYGW